MYPASCNDQLQYLSIIDKLGIVGRQQREVSDRNQHIYTTEHWQYIHSTYTPKATTKITGNQDTASTGGWKQQNKIIVGNARICGQHIYGKKPLWGKLWGEKTKIKSIPGASLEWKIMFHHHHDGLGRYWNWCRRQCFTATRTHQCMEKKKRET